MNKKELEQKLIEINQRLESLGNLSTLTSEFNSTKQQIETLVSDLLNKKPQIDNITNSLPEKEKELNQLIINAENLKTEIEGHLLKSKENEESANNIKVKIDDIQALSLEQLGKISNEKLSNSFDKVKDKLIEASKKWFKWLLWTSILLLLFIIVIVVWQIKIGDSIFQISFLIKLALTSPIIFFEFFVSREYSRTQRLAEEYEFKSSIARSLEAYKEIVINLFDDVKNGEFEHKKLDFILDSINSLYSSPMSNIKHNENRNSDNSKMVIPVLTDIKDIVSDVKNIVSK